MIQMGKIFTNRPERIAALLFAFCLLILLLFTAAFHSFRLAANRALSPSFRGLPTKNVFLPLPFQKGVNFTAEWPDTYSSAGADWMLEQLPKYGVDAVALVPYGFTPRNSPKVYFGHGWERDQGIEHLSELAHRLGMRVMLKPQIWVRPGYPGILEFDSNDLIQWFAQYERFLDHYAQLATRIHADLFCVGVEFVKLTEHTEAWRKLITRTREQYPGPLVYAANSGSEFEKVSFWGDLDYIGLNNYYSLPDDLSMGVIVDKIEAVQRRYGRPIIFTEAGFSSFEAPYRQPWDETPRRLSPLDQARCYEAVFHAFYEKPWLRGIYWWKVGSNGYGGPNDGSHTPWDKPAMDVIARWYFKPVLRKE
jgi:hypothetical protein